MEHRTHAAIAIALVFAPVVFSAELQPERFRVAAEKAIGLIESSQKSWDSKRLGEGGCTSCHHQLLPALAFRVAREHGLPVNEDVAHADAVQAYSFYANFDRAVQYTHVIEPSMFDAFRMIAEDAVGGRPNVVRAVYARLIASRQSGSGAWDRDSFHQRPPSSYSAFTHTALAVRALRLYAHSNLKSDTEARVSRARSWLLSTTPRDTEERTFQLLGLRWAGADQTALQKLGAQLVATQRTDGGWNSLDGRASDAYSTAEALVALHDAGNVPASNAAWQRGLEFLLKAQSPDGSWHVSSRLQPTLPLSPPYMETSYPYGHDQFISITAASWAIMAFSSALGPAHTVTVPPVPQAEPSNVEPWAETILFGTAADVKRLLASGFDPNSATKSGDTTALMMAVPDVEKMKLLMDRGANVNARAKTKYSALLVAAQYQDSSDAIRLLLDRGAQVQAPKGQGVPLFNANALFLAAYAGNVQSLRMLRDAGDRVDTRVAVLGQAPMSPLASAVSVGNTAVVRALLELGAPVDQGESEDGDLTPLARATMGNETEIARLLIAHGAKVNQVDKQGMTPLLYAASVDFGDSAMVDLLLSSGANPKMRTKDGHTALELARQCRSTHLLASLGGSSPRQ